MCGRFALFADDDELVSLFDIDLLPDESGPSYNIAPSQPVAVVMERTVDDSESVGLDGDRPRTRRQLRRLQWGLVPSWSKTPGRPMINARAETLTEKASFRGAAVHRRCLIPANGYFEWQAPAEGATTKQAWFLSGGPGDPVMAFAGVYEAWKLPRSEGDRENRWLLTCAIVTRAASDFLGEIHDRAPVVVPEPAWDSWLDPRLVDRGQVDAMLHSMPDPHLVPRHVGPAVNDVRTDEPGLIDPID